MDHSDATKRISFPMIALGFLGVMAVVVIAADYWSAKPMGITATYVGRSQCIDCHREQATSFRGSHHDRAMEIATEDSVLGDFSDVSFEHDGITSRLYRDHDRFMVRTEGETGELEAFEIKYVFGVEPLQQYMVEFDRPADALADQVSRLQVLRISWDTEQNEWFYLRAPDVLEKLEPGDPLHWTGFAQRWQTMCAKCHSTDLRKNFDVQTVSYHTTFSEIDVSCEACHGPGSLHVELANQRSLFWDRNHGYGLVMLKGKDSQMQLESCAPCHSRRGDLTEEWEPGSSFCNHFQLESLRAQSYHDDGQIKEEVYVYGSFLQSKMYHKGIRCTDCHDPHSLKLKHPGNQTCTSCHQHASGKYDTPSHHHHAVGSPGAMCVNCHMPHTTFMEVDPRRDHSLRVPRPDLSIKIGTPNACSGCHIQDQLRNLDKDDHQQLENAEYAAWRTLAQRNEAVRSAVEATDQWCDDACEKWYGSNRRTPEHFAETFAAFRAGEPDSVQSMLKLAIHEGKDSGWIPEIARATALNELADRGVLQGREVLPVLPLVESLQTPPMIRAAAVRVLGRGDAHRIRKPLLARLKDPSALVRIAAANTILQSELYRRLDGGDRLSVDQVTDRDIHGSLMAASDRAISHLAWAGIAEQRGKFNDAVRSYQSAMRVEPGATGARTNLAVLLERLAEQEPGNRASVMIERANQLRAEELPLLERDAGLAPQNAIIQNWYGRALYLDGQMEEALKRLTRASELDPGNTLFQQAKQSLQNKLDSNLPSKGRNRGTDSGK